MKKITLPIIFILIFLFIFTFPIKAQSTIFNEVVNLVKKIFVKEQGIGRDGGKGVAPKAILDAVKNPSTVVQQAEGAVKYIGDTATVVLNEAGKIITSWATSGQGLRNP